MEPTVPDKNDRNDEAGTNKPDASQATTTGKPGESATGTSQPSVSAPGEAAAPTAAPEPPVTAAPTTEPGKTGAAKTEPSQTDKPATDKPGAAKPTGSTTRPKDVGAGKPPPVKPRDTSTSGSGGGRGLSALALLVALGALGLSGWQWYQQQSEPDVSATLDARFDQLAADQEQSLRQVREQMQQQLQDLPSSAEVDETRRLAADLQRSQQALSQQLEEMRGDTDADWKLDEAEYMLRLASLRLLAAQDVESAGELLQLVDRILREQPDSGVFAVREELARFQTQLESLPEIDRPGVYLRLAALRDRVNDIVALPVREFSPDEQSATSSDPEASRFDRVMARLERYVRVDFQRGKVITPQLTAAEMNRVRRTLQLAIEQAQWAALRGEAEIFQSSLEQADSVLQRFFEGDNPEVNSLREQLANVAEQDISLEPPDIAPVQQALATYMQSRRSQSNGQRDGGGKSGDNAGESGNE